MTPETILELTRNVLFLTLLLTAPIVITAAVLGVAIGFLQAVTSIQDSTIGVAIQLIVIGVLLVLLANWFGREVLFFATRVFDQIGNI